MVDAQTELRIAVTALGFGVSGWDRPGQPVADAYRGVGEALGEIVTGRAGTRRGDRPRGLSFWACNCRIFLQLTKLL